MTENETAEIPGYDYGRETVSESFLNSAGRSEHDLQSIQSGWTRAVLLTIALWARPYTSPGLW